MQRVENAFSRIPNGNFSHGAAHWGARLPVDVDYSPADLLPHYLLKAWSEFWVDIPYRDLSQYPSVVDMTAAQMQPIAPGKFYILVSAKYAGSDVYAFQARPDGVWGSKAVAGDPLYMDDYDLELYSGTYRIHSVMDGNRALVSSSAPVATILTGDQAIGFYSRPSGSSTPVFRVDVDIDVRQVVRPDGRSGGVEIGDYFVSATPPISGILSQIALDGKSFFVYSVAPHTPPAPTGGAQVALGLDWQILPYTRAHIRRKLPVCLYDLTLAYTLSDGAVVSPQDVRLELYSEAGVLLATKAPVILDTGNLRYLAKVIPGTYKGVTFKRYVQRFMFERQEPHDGITRVRFGAVNTSGSSYFGEAVLLKGDYTSYLAAPVGSGRTFSYLERPVCDESEIVPRGTVVAYVGGNACPAGFTRVEGIGGDGSTFDNYNSLRCDLGSFALLGSAKYGLRYRDGDAEPRTFFSYQVTTSRTDICAGYSLEFRFSDHSVFAIISAATQLQFSDPYTTDGDKYFEVELVGDYLGVVGKARSLPTAGTLVVWRGGVLSTAQNAPDLPTNFKSCGGFSLAGPPHRHAVGQSVDIKIADDIGIPFRDKPNGQELGSVEIRRFQEHRHFPMRTASAVPKVRPVLLCQKI